MANRLHVPGFREFEHMYLRILLAAPLLLLIACESVRHDAFCPLAGDNYLQDSDFALEAENKRSQHWGSLQHAGGHSFNTSIADGELTIAKVGDVEWFVYRQLLRTRDLAGKKMVFSAELKFDLQPPAVPHGWKAGGGLNVVARADGGKLLLLSSLNHEPHMGTHDWHEVQVIVLLPADTSMIEVGFLHQADGTLQVRKPAFHVVKGNSAACAVTPEM